MFKLSWVRNLAVVWLGVWVAVGFASAAEVDNKKAKLAAPVFSHASGFYPEAFDLILSHPDPDATIYYTLDGSDPDPQNLQGTTFSYKNSYAQPPATDPGDNFLYREYKTYKYSQPIPIVDRTFEPDRISQISTTLDAVPWYFPTAKLAKTFENKIKNTLNKIIRRVNKWLALLDSRWQSYVSGGVEPKVVEKEYIGFFELKYLNEWTYKGTPIKAVVQNSKGDISKLVSRVLFIGDMNKYGLPVLNIIIPEKELFDYEQGILVAGKTYDDFLRNRSQDDELKSTWYPANYRSRSIAQAKRNALLTVFNDGVVTETPVRVTGHGGSSRNRNNKSLRLYPSSKKGGKELGVVFKDYSSDRIRVNLRNGGNFADNSYIKDVALHEISTGLNFAKQRYQSYSVFVNGEYFGILNAMDRKDSHYVASLFELPDRNIDLLKGKGTADRGDSLEYKRLLHMIEHEDRKTEEFYEALSERMDIGSFVDLYVSSIYWARYDWPHNNIAYWRYKGEQIDSNPYTDGKWRWVLYDADASYRVDHNTLLFALGESDTPRLVPEWSSFLLRSLLENPKVREYFVIRSADLLNSHFTVQRASLIVTNIIETLKEGMQQHINRWKRPSNNFKSWVKSSGAVLSFVNERPEHLWLHLEEYFELEGRYQVEINANLQASGRIGVNTLQLGEKLDQELHNTDTNLLLPWSGQYFKKMPLTLEAIPAEHYRFSHWQVEGLELSDDQKNQPKLVLYPQQDLSVIAVMVAEKVH